MGRGMLCEEPVHRFQNMIIDRMVGIDRIPDGDEAVANVRSRLIPISGINKRNRSRFGRSITVRCLNNHVASLN